MIHADFHRDELLSVSSQASRFSSEILLSYTEADHEHRVDVKSLLGMALLPLRNGSMVRLQTRGRDELEALEYMLHVLEKGSA
ncbi:HPr family phosphocarrier protein [Paenibacillus silvae]|nr:HPr family phosphocarrier protein [Paenibacillus silvae]MCK6078230.1 HPr family phosphocarrier protein [Paenibacillus silvae]MCK6152572.1 HPr family phosphocarrier protein [Paenibacillus silvae]MCK6271033.1 HPr family phosphocarrier protein [Paenibacillus silvae]